MARSAAGVLQAGRARPEPDHRQQSPGPAEPCGVDRRRCLGDRAGGPCRLGLGDPQHAVVTGGGERGGLRDAVAAHFPEHHVGRVGEPRCQGFESRRVEESHLQPQCSSQSMHGRLVRLEIDREDPRQRPGGQVGPGQRDFDQTLQLARRNAAFATHPQGEAPWMKDQGIFIAGIRRIGHPHRERRVGLELDPRVGQPLRLTLQTTPLSCQQPGHERLVVLRVRKDPSGARLVQGHPPAGLAGGGDRGRRAERLAQAAADLVGAAMAAEEGHDRAAVFRDGNDRGLLALVGERGRQGSEQDSGGAHTDDVDSRGEQPAQLGPDFVELNVGVRHPGGIAVNPRSGQTRPDPPGRDESMLGQHYDGNRVTHSTLRRSSAPTSSNRMSAHLPRSIAANRDSVQTGPDASGSDLARMGQHHDGYRVRHSTHRRGRAAESSRSTARYLRRHRQVEESSRSSWSHARRSGRSWSGPSPRSRLALVADAGRP